VLERFLRDAGGNPKLTADDADNTDLRYLNRVIVRDLVIG